MNWFKGRHFNQDIITVAVGYYFRFNLSYRDVVRSGCFGTPYNDHALGSPLWRNLPDAVASA